MTLLLALSSVLSRILGVYRNHELANLFGASDMSDAYFAAFQIPDTLYRLVVFGAISASFVPLFLKLKKESEEQAWSFVNSVMNGFAMMVGAVSLLLFFGAEPMVRLLYPAFTGELLETTTQLLRIMLISPLLFSISSVFSSVQNAFRQFWGFALAPIVYNAGIIFGIEYLAPQYGITGVAYGVILGAFLHGVVQLWPCVKLGMRWRPEFRWDESLRQLFVTGIPRILTMASVQLNFFIEGVIATGLMTGSITVLRYSQDMQSFPIGVIGVSVAISSFSVLSGYVVDGRPDLLGKYVSRKLDQLLVLLIPASFGLAVLRRPLIELMLAGGNFGEDAIATTSQSLLYLSIGLVAAAILPLISRVFFAFHDTMRPLGVGVMMVLTNTVLAVMLGKIMGISGVALANSASSLLAVIASLWLLKRSHLRDSVLFSGGRILIYLLSSALMAWLIQAGVAHFGLPETFLSQALAVSAWVIAGIFVYLLLIVLCLREEAWQLIRSVRKHEMEDLSG